MTPYRWPLYATWSEEESWLRLDHALEMALINPVDASRIAFEVFMESAIYPDVRRAAIAVLECCNPLPDDA